MMIFLCAIDSTAIVDTPRYLVFVLTPPELGDRALGSWECSEKTDNIEDLQLDNIIEIAFLVTLKPPSNPFLVTN